MKVMQGNVRTRCALVVSALLLLLGWGASAEAVDVSGKFRVQPSFFLGVGSSSVDVGKTDQGDTVSISGGGGAGMGVTLGYGLHPRFDLDFTLGYQISTLSPAVSGADGKFTRTFYLASLMYRIPFRDRFVFKVGGGVGLYMPGELDIDTSSVSGGAHDVVQYDNATGTHVLADFEIFFRKDMSVSFGAKYYSVTYKESSGTHNGAPVIFTDNNVRNFDGSGVDVMASLAKYF